MPADILGFGYALTVAAGGIIGYLKAGNFFIELLAVLQCFWYDFVAVCGMGTTDVCSYVQKHVIEAQEGFSKFSANVRRKLGKAL